MKPQILSLFFFIKIGEVFFVFLLLIISMDSNIEFYYEYEDTYDGSYRLYPLNKEEYDEQLQQLLLLKDGETG